MVLKQLYPKTGGEIGACDQLLTLLALFGRVRQSFSLAPFLFNFSTKNVLWNALFPQEMGLNSSQEAKFDSDYAGDIALRNDNA